jgi:hypothetical protein
MQKLHTRSLVKSATKPKVTATTSLTQVSSTTKEKVKERPERNGVFDRGYDSQEDRIAERELHRLQESNGEAPPLWSLMPEFRGMSRATAGPYNLRNRAGFIQVEEH